MVIIIPVGLITSCFRSASQDSRRRAQYVLQPAQTQVVVVQHHQQQQTCVQNRAYYPAYRQAPSAQTQVGYRQVPPVTSHQQPPPYYAATQGYPHQNQRPTQIHSNARVPQQSQQPPTVTSAAQASGSAAGGSHRRKPWQRRSKDGYTYTLLDN